MKLAKDDVIAALRLRYDYYSAQTVFDVARERAGLADQASYELAHVTAFRSALEAVGDRVEKVQARLDALLEGASGASAPAPAPAPAGEPAPSPAAAPEPAPAPEKARASDKGKRGADAKADKSDKADKASDPSPIETTIVLTGVEPKPGEVVLMCGGLPELGDWEPEGARELVRKGAQWVTTLKLAPDARIAFKFLRRAASGKVTWEAGDDRELAAAPRFEATWR